MRQHLQLMQATALLILCCAGCVIAAPSGKSACPSRKQSTSECNKHNLRTLTITYYKWNAALAKCQSRIELKEVPCGSGGAVKGKCPEPRIVEPGKCNSATKQEKTLIEHYEPDGKGGCKLHKTFTYPKCPDHPRPDTGCPEPRFYQKPCAGRMRQVFKFYFVPAAGGKAGKCIEKTSISVEPCGALLKQHKCPPPKLMERGACKSGYRTIIEQSFTRDPSGHCQSRSRFITEACSSASGRVCPSTRVTEGPCRHGVRGTTKLYYEWDTSRKRCVRKFSISTKVCSGKGRGGKKRSCPSPRIMEPGPCSSDGHTRVLVAHYEPEGATGKCREVKTFVTHSCPTGEKETKGDKKKKEEEEDRCPEKRYSQGPCKAGYRNLFTFTFKYLSALSRCVKHVALKRESCAALVTSSKCPKDDKIERGPCIDGFRSNIVYRHIRNDKGRCISKTIKMASPCMHSTKASCSPKKVTKLGECKDRLQRWQTEYFEYSELKRRCIRKFKIRERPCGKAAAAAAAGAAAKGKKVHCPQPRVIEPGPCNSATGKQRVLVEHYEFNAKTKRCEPSKDYEMRKCAVKAKARRGKGKAKRLHCPEAKVTQTACKSGYRTITTVYYEYQAERGRCVSKIKQKEEKCAKFVKGSSCPADSTVEEGPCKAGYRSSIVYKYKRDADGSCKRLAVRITLTCRSLAVSCPPKTRKKMNSCKDGIERWLTEYHVYSKLKRRCVRKLRFKEISCKKSKRKCPTPRVIEPGPCKDGKQRVLIEHYEFNAKVKRCEAVKDFVEKKCGSAKKSTAKSAKSAKAAKAHPCPDPVFHQQPCRKKYRSVMKIYSEWSEVKGRCVKRIKMEEEPCAALLTTGCPPDETVETGPCNHGYRSNILFSHVRDAAGKCQSVEKRVVQKCSSGDTVPKCKPRHRKLVNDCGKSGLQRWLTVYFVYNSLKKRCIRKLRFKEVSCSKKRCPTPRVIEPGSCKLGKQRVLIEHYEQNSATGECKRMQDYVVKPCGAPSARKLAALKHNCPDSVFHQSPCRSSGYRTVTKKYYRFNESRGRCVSNIKVDDEKCAKLTAVKSSCHADEVVETGPCQRGYRQNIIYKYARDKDGSCNREEHRISEKCEIK